MLAGCTIDERPSLDQMLPPQVGQYVRITGPALDLDTGIDYAEYQGPEGSVTIRIKLVGKDQVAHALSQLPPNVTDARVDPALGARAGSFFTFAGEYHAVWGSGDWVFILSTPVDSARAAFISNYGF